MTWMFWLTIAVVLAGIAALTGLQPKGGRQVAGTRLMGVGRMVLVVFVLICAFLAFQARSGS